MPYTVALVLVLANLGEGGAYLCAVIVGGGSLLALPPCFVHKRRGKDATTANFVIAVVVGVLAVGPAVAGFWACSSRYGATRSIDSSENAPYCWRNRSSLPS